MIKGLFHAAVTILLVTQTLRAGPTLSPTAMHRLSDATAAKAGSFTTGDLWLWNSQLNVVTRLSANGSERTSGVLPPATSIDVSEQQGIVVLTEGGNTIEVLSWNGNRISTFNLLSPAADVAWLSGSQVAVTPMFNSSRVEIWDTIMARLTRSIGRCQPVSRGPGAHLARATLVRYDAQRSRIVALDATFGHMFFYVGDGTAESEVTLPVAAPALAELLSRLAESDDSRPAVSDALVWQYPTLSLRNDGTAWVGVPSRKSGVVRAVTCTLDGRTETLAAEVRTCESSRLQNWHDGVVLFRDAAFLFVPCVTVVNATDFRKAPSDPRQRDPVTERRECLRPLWLTQLDATSCTYCSLAQCGCADPSPGYKLKASCTCSDTQCTHSCEYTAK